MADDIQALLSTLNRGDYPEDFEDLKKRLADFKGKLVSQVVTEDAKLN